MIIDRLFPNFIFTTVLDVDFDSTSQKTYYEKKYKILGRQRYRDEDEIDGSSRNGTVAIHKKPEMPPFMQELKKRSKEKKRNADKHLNLAEGVPDRKAIGSAIGVKLNPAYLSDAASENTSMGRYDVSMEHKQAISSATSNKEQIQREPRVETNAKSKQDERVITPREQTIRL